MGDLRRVVPRSCDLGVLLHFSNKEGLTGDWPRWRPITWQVFYGRRVEIKASDIVEIYYYDMTWKIRQINLYDRTKPGVEIRLKDGTIMRINAKTEGFDSLIAALMVFAETNQIKSDLARMALT